MSVTVPATTPRQQKQITVAAIDNRKVLDTPLDYSFSSLTLPSDLECEEPREHCGKKVPKVVCHETQEDGTVTEVEKYKTKILKFNNNHIADPKTLHEVLPKIVMEPTAITWIDLSFNEMVKIDSIFCDFPNLQILYLHGNGINDINEVDKLGGAPNLRKLTLHGNPMDTTKNYRWYVLSQIPHLTSFDFSAITKADRSTANTWNKNNQATKKKKKSSDD